MAFPIDHSDEYEGMGLTYQLLEVARLNEVLKRHNLPQSVRKAVCGDYFFESGDFLDQGSFGHEGRRLFPTLCFAERIVHPQRGILDIIRLFLPSQSYSFHEYEQSATYFEDRQEKIDDVELF